MCVEATLRLYYQQGLSASRPRVCRCYDIVSIELRSVRICADDTEVLDLIDRVVQEKPGGDKKSPEYKIIVNNVNNDSTRPVGNNRQQALRKLRKDSPTLHAEVLAGKLSPQSKKATLESIASFV